MVTIQWASAMRDYIACETVCGKGDWLDDIILHDDPIFQGGFILYQSAGQDGNRN